MQNLYWECLENVAGRGTWNLHGPSSILGPGFLTVVEVAHSSKGVPLLVCMQLERSLGSSARYLKLGKFAGLGRKALCQAYMAVCLTALTGNLATLSQDGDSGARRRLKAGRVLQVDHCLSRLVQWICDSDLVKLKAQTSHWSSHAGKLTSGMQWQTNVELWKYGASALQEDRNTVRHRHESNWYSRVQVKKKWLLMRGCHPREAAFLTDRLILNWGALFTWYICNVTHCLTFGAMDWLTEKESFQNERTVLLKMSCRDKWRGHQQQQNHAGASAEKGAPEA